MNIIAIVLIFKFITFISGHAAISFQADDKHRKLFFKKVAKKIG